MTLSMVTLTGRYQTPTGGPETGTVTFTPATTLQSSSSTIIIQPQPVTATLDGTGSFSVSLLATDATGVTPTGWTYTVSEKLGPATAQVGRTYSIQLPQAVTPVDLSTISPVSPSGPVSQFGALGSNNTWTGTNTFSAAVALNGGVTLASALPINQGGTGATSAPSARTALGLGTASTSNIDVTNTDIQPLGTQAAGSTGQIADAGHVHPMIAGATTGAQGIVQLAGDLGGTAASPSVLKVNGVSVTGTPAAGYVPFASGTTAASWSPMGVPLKSTYYYPSDGQGGSRTMTYQLLWIFPFDLQRAITITKLACNVTTAGTAGSTIRLGIYSSDGAGGIGNLLIDGGTVAGDSTGIKTATISQAAGPDRIWLCAAWQGTNTTAPVLQGYARSAPFIGWSSFVQFPPLMGYQYAGITGALPASLAAPTSNENSMLPAVQFTPQ
jgi:hypothetical protein